MMLPDTCQPTSHQGLSCVTPDDAAHQDQSWATLHPILPPGEVGRTMLIASDPPRSWSNGMDLFNGEHVAATCTNPSSAFTGWQKPLPVCLWWEDVAQEVQDQLTWNYSP